MQTVSDELCREYRLSVIENPQYGKAKQYGEWRAEQEQRPTWRGLIRTDMDEAIRQSIMRYWGMVCRSIKIHFGCLY